MSTPLQVVERALVDHGCKGKGNSWQCPGHEDQHPSLSVTEGNDGRVLLNCWAGCTAEIVVAALGLTMSDLFPLREERHIEAVYQYCDEKGAILFEKVRFRPKGFSQRRPDGNGGYVWNIGGVGPVPYRLPQTLIAMAQDKTVFLAEGEKGADALEKAGVVATTTGGAKSWRHEHAPFFKGARVVIVPDNDEAGREYARVAGRDLVKTATEVRVLELPGLPESGDPFDFIAAGGTMEQLDRLAAEAPTFTEWANAKEEKGDGRRLIATSTLFDEYLARKTTIVPCALAGLGKLLGGGFETGKNAVVTAPAGGGKTGFLVQHAAYAVLHGNFFAVLALKDGDQWTDGLRLAQMAGVDRFDLRDRVREAVEAARQAMARYADRLVFYDVAQSGASFADMAERALRWVNGRGHLLVGTDSIHVFPAADQAKERAMPIYDRIAIRLETIHDFVVANEAAGLTVGQSGRSSYSRKKDEENVDLLAAVSGGHIAENTVDVLIVATKPNESGTRFLVVPKSRLGGQGSRIPVTYDEERSMWLDAVPVAEQAAPKESRAKARQAAKDEVERKAKEAIGLLLRRKPEGMTIEEVRQASGRRREWVASVIEELHARGTIRSEVVQRLDSKKRKIPVSVWKWEIGGTT